MEEYLIVAHNFRIPVDVIIAGRHVVALVEQIDEDDRILIDGQWYPIGDVQYAQ